MGSDVDLLAIVERSDRPFAERRLDSALEGLPVSADLLVYTAKEGEALMREGAPFVRRLAAETVWVWGRWKTRAPGRPSKH